MNARPVHAVVDLDAVRHNTSLLVRLAAPAEVCAVVKAFAYGHGPVEMARAALDGGAKRLAVALVEEGAVLRDAGVAAPILLLSEPPAAAMADVVALGLTATVYTPEGAEALARAAAAATPAIQPVPVHVKVDTGMHRVGAAHADAVKLAQAVERSPRLVLEGMWTHFAVADAVDDPFTAVQATRFRSALDELAAAGIHPPLRHACNSAGTLAHPESRFDMVRCGIAMYGVGPSASLARAPLFAGFRPALSMHARVSYVKEVDEGDALSYGLHYRVRERSVIATVPIGYADGVPWRLAPTGGEVLVGGERRPIAGSVTMDQILVDCGPGAMVAPGDEVVLLGRQGVQEIGAWEWAERVGTIAYEVLCGIGARVPRTYVGSGGVG